MLMLHRFWFSFPVLGAFAILNIDSEHSFIILRQFFILPCMFNFDHFFQPWVPIVDGVTIPENPIQLLEDGDFVKSDSLLGKLPDITCCPTNANEPILLLE